MLSELTSVFIAFSLAFAGPGVVRARWVAGVFNPPLNLPLAHAGGVQAVRVLLRGPVGTGERWDTDRVGHGQWWCLSVGQMDTPG